MPADSGAELAGFLEAAGRSLAEAQGALAGEAVDVPSAVAISDAELEVKATLESRPGGGVALQTVSTADIARGGITPGLLSTVRIRYVAVAEATVVRAPDRPARTPGAVIEDVKGREDVAALERILGDLVYEAVFVPSTRRWLVTARDEEARLVREVVVADETTRR